MDETAGQIFVTSGTGVVGFRVAMGLLDAGYKHVRVGVWKGARQMGVDTSIGQRVQDKLEEKGASVIAYDWTNEKDYTMALAGVKTVVCTLPHTQIPVETFGKFVTECRTQGVEHFIKTSFYELPGDPYNETVPFVQLHRQCDALLQNIHGSDPHTMKVPSFLHFRHQQHDESQTTNQLPNGMTYTVLAASHRMSTPLIYQGPVLRNEAADEAGGKYVTASYAMGVNYVSPNDIANAAIATVANRKEHCNKTYFLSGPGPITDKVVCKNLSKFYGKKIRHVALGYNEIIDELKEHGFDNWLNQDFAEFEKVKASGVEEFHSAYTKDFEMLVGRKPETYVEYLASKDSMTLQENPDSAYNQNLEGIDDIVEC